MITLPASIVQELHKISSDGSIIYLAEIVITPTSEHIRLARNVDDVAWDGQTWSKAWFEIETIPEGSSGEIPELYMYTSNIGGLMEGEILSRNDLADSKCTLYLVNSNCLDETIPVFSTTFDVMKVMCDNETVKIKLSTYNPYLQSFPAWRIHGSLCQYPVFKGSRCGYSGAATTCDRAFLTCLNYGNSARFGAFPGIMKEVVDV